MTKELTEKEFKNTFGNGMTDIMETDEPIDIWNYVKHLTENQNVFLTIVVDLKNKKVFGHKILNLNKEYGIE